MEFAGGTPMPFEGRKTIYAANITPAVNGIPYYTEDLFLEVMRTGKVKARELDPMMPTAFYRNMSDQDLKDIFAYLKTLKPVEHTWTTRRPANRCARTAASSHGGGETETRNRIWDLYLAVWTAGLAAGLFERGAAPPSLPCARLPARGW